MNLTAEVTYLVSVSREKADVAISFRPAKRVLAALAPMLVIWGVQPSDLAAQSACPPPPAEFEEADAAATVNGQTITHGEIEERARLLALSADINKEAKENFQRLVKAQSTKDKLRSLEEDVVHSNPGKSRDELIAIFRERQKELGLALQKQAIESARCGLLPKLRQDAKEELITERLKRREAN